MLTPKEEERFVAYVDGELSPAEAEEVERRLTRDPEARACVEAMRETALLLRAAFNSSLQAPVPRHLLDALESAPRRSPAPAPRRFRPLALAAAIAALAIGLGGGYFLASIRIERAMQELAAARIDERKMIETAVSEALERHVSGVPAQWSSADGRRGLVTPIRTFRTAGGEWCREYEQVIQLGDEVETRRGIACRSTEGGWTRRLEMPGS
jgi:anti-sigma factor RsiW